ncbi:MAG TPA: hypothetical protein VL970_06125, partial [Candidatus Acidoferrales bacterium]|nr:hypothetical protein [Candidatus Acidoferrales bacterium]
MKTTSLLLLFVLAALAASAQFPPQRRTPGFPAFPAPPPMSRAPAVPNPGAPANSTANPAFPPAANPS